jgi:hypothetical protein
LAISHTARANWLIPSGAIKKKWMEYPKMGMVTAVISSATPISPKTPSDGGCPLLQIPRI